LSGRSMCNILLALMWTTSIEANGHIAVVAQHTKAFRPSGPSQPNGHFESTIRSLLPMLLSSPLFVVESKEFVGRLSTTCTLGRISTVMSQRQQTNSFLACSRRLSVEVRVFPSPIPDVHTTAFATPCLELVLAAVVQCVHMKRSRDPTPFAYPENKRPSAFFPTDVSVGARYTYCGQAILGFSRKTKRTTPFPRRAIDTSFAVAKLERYDRLIHSHAPSIAQVVARGRRPCLRVSASFIIGQFEERVNPAKLGIKVS